MVAHPTILVEELKILGRFLRLTLLRFFSALDEDTYEFLVICEVRIYNLGIVETHDVDYTTFLLDLVARHLLRCHFDSRVTGSPH